MKSLEEKALNLSEESLKIDGIEVLEELGLDETDHADGKHEIEDLLPEPNIEFESRLEQEMVPSQTDKPELLGSQVSQEPTQEVSQEPTQEVSQEPTKEVSQETIQDNASITK